MADRETSEAPIPSGPLPFLKVPLRSVRGEIRAYATIDACDARLLESRWYLNSQGYAVRNDPIPGERTKDGKQKQRTVPMHRVILGLAPGDGLECDHISRDKLDNRRLNMRVTTHAQNMQNRVWRGGSSRYRGVSWSTQKGRWVARAKLAGKDHYIGAFDDEDEAGTAAAAFRAEHMPFATD